MIAGVTMLSMQLSSHLLSMQAPGSCRPAVAEAVHGSATAEPPAISQLQHTSQPGAD